ncbi:hypothetical protein [Streptomyces sp. NPDC126933]|uniref:hypothetical protein n=1 Tax=unclassified Streptomyces TaxID=2593676 RepID=UPI00366602FE
MAYDIPGGIGSTGDSDTADILKRLDTLRENGPTWDDFMGRVVDDTAVNASLSGSGRCPRCGYLRESFSGHTCREAATLGEIRSLLEGGALPERATADGAALAEIRDLLTEPPIILEEAALKSVVLEESARLVRAE